MTEPRTARRAGRRHVEVLEAAAEIVAARGVEATRFADVAAVAGVGASTLQYWFGSREDMLIAVLRHVAERDLDIVSSYLAGEPDPWRQLVYLAAFLTGNTDDRNELGWRLWVEWWRWALRDDEVRTQVLQDYTRWRQLIAESITAGHAARVFTSSQSPLELAHQILALFDGLALPAALGDPVVSPRQAHALLIDGVARLVGHQPGRP